MPDQKTKFDDGRWKHEIRKVSELHPNPDNPRTITKETLKGLKRSMKKNDKHPCLPAGTKVWFSDRWKNIEDVGIGDTNQYGQVIARTVHDAYNMVDITVGNDTIRATWNHPFLILRNKDIMWINANQIKKGDKVLQHKGSYKCRHKKGIYESTTQNPKNFVWNTILFGKKHMEKFLSECKYITKILTKQTIVFPISNLSTPLRTSGCTLIACLNKENGINDARHAISIKNVAQNFGTLIKKSGLLGRCAKRAALNKSLKNAEFVLQTVGNVKIIKKKTKVYNLTISDIPAFDTIFATTHNTMKPVKLLARLIRNSSNVGDIVLDLFGGSGSTMMACEQIGRKCYTNELDPHYCDVIIERWEQMTGKTATKIN